MKKLLKIVARQREEETANVVGDFFVVERRGGLAQFVDGGFPASESEIKFPKFEADVRVVRTFGERAFERGGRVVELAERDERFRQLEASVDEIFVEFERRVKSFASRREVAEQIKEFSQPEADAGVEPARQERAAIEPRRFFPIPFAFEVPSGFAKSDDSAFRRVAPTFASGFVERENGARRL